MKIVVKLISNKQFDMFISLVEKFEKVNTELKFTKLKVVFKYDMKSVGEFYDETPNTILVNPNRCNQTGEYSFYLICLHEWAHLLDKKFKMWKVYKEEYKNNQLNITKYAECCDMIEQLAEIIVLYLTNPYLLKLISYKHFKFVKGYFKSPTPCTPDFFAGEYEKFSQGYPNKIWNKYGIQVKGNKIYQSRKVYKQIERRKK